tara:strand:+ start:247 stop:456 length:210 start_codon:yes stop_codon:yes gene_type:complete
MTKLKLKELQTEIARLEKLDIPLYKKLDATKRVNAEIERISNTEQKVHHSQIYIPCSLDLDYEMQYQSE